MNDLSERDITVLRMALKAELQPGTILIFQTSMSMVKEVGDRVKDIMPLLKNYGITCLVIDDDTGFVAVPESRRVIFLPRDHKGVVINE